MKSLDEFLVLPLEEQFDYVWNCCKHLASRKEGEKQLVNLYYGSGMFVEVWFDADWNIVRICAFTKYAQLEKYLEGISIESLFD